MLSYEEIENGRNDGTVVSLEEEYQYVRLSVTQKSSNTSLFEKYLGEKSQFTEFTDEETIARIRNTYNRRITKIERYTKR